MMSKDIKILREKIDRVDAKIIKNLAARGKLSLQIGRLKAASSQRIVDLTRETQQKNQYEKLCVLHGLDNAFVQRLFKLIIAHSRQLQKYAK